MEWMHTVTRAFCIACFIVGSVLHIVQGASLRNGIKVTAGLYILVVVMRSIQSPQTTAEFPTFQADNSESSATQLLCDFEDAVLQQSCFDLEQKLNQSLAERGIDASVHLKLNAGAEGVYVETASISVADPSDREEAVRYLQQQLQVSSVRYDSEG